jgi:hypothetical protein
MYPLPLAIFDLLWAIVWAVGISIAAGYIGQALFRQDLPEAEAPEDASGRLWNPHTTQGEGLARPRCYGKNMHHGNIIAKWTDVDGNDREILYLLLEHGDGPTKGNVAEQIWLNDQPISNFGSVTVQERKGTMDQTCMTGFEKLKLPYVENKELKQADGEYIWTTPNTFFDDIEFTICFPNGLARWKKSGSKRDTHVHFHIRIREYPSGGWTNIVDADITAGATTPYFKKYSASGQGFTCSRGKQYDLGFTRITADGGERVVNNSFVRSIREVVDVAFTHPGKALTGIKAVATTKLSGNIDVKIIREDRLVNVFNGTSWNIEYSRNRAWVAYDLLSQPVISGNGDTIPWKIERYEGIDPSYLDLDFFYNWAAFCSDQVSDGYGGTEDRLACDIKVDYQTDVWSLVHDIAEIGRAHLYWKGNVLTGWIDKAVSEATDLVTMDTIMARTWQNHWAKWPELAGVVTVYYEDEKQGYERVPAVYPKAEAGSYKRTISIEGTGITTYGTAIHAANHALTRNHLIRNINAFKQFKDGFRHKVGEVIRLQHRTPNWGQGYRVVNCPSASVVKLDRVVTDVSANDLLYVRSYDVSGQAVDISVYTVASVSGKEITIEETWSPTPIKNNIVAVGVAGAVVLRRIIKVEPDVTNYFDITVETYDADLYDADNLDPDAPNKNYLWNRPSDSIATPVTREEVVDDIPQLSNRQWNDDTPSSGYISWSKADSTEDIVFRFQGTDYAITPDNTNDEFIYWDPNYTTQFRTTNSVATATAAGNWLMCRNIEGTAYPADGIMLAQIGILLGGFLVIGTADIEDAAITTAKINNLNVTTLKIADDAVTVPVSAYTDGGMTIDTTLRTLVSVGITTEGGTVMVICNVFLGTTDLTDLLLYVVRDSTTIHTSSTIRVFFNSKGYQTIVLKDTPGTGTFTYYFKAKRTGGNVNATGSKRTIFVMETKK